MTQETLRILLVEDDEEDYVIASRLLSKVPGHVFDIVWKKNLGEGLAATDETFDAILLDLTLPDSHGWETFTTMLDRAGHVPIILLTGATDEALGVRAVKEGAQDYLNKGQIDGALLSRSIRYAIERKQIEEDRERIARELRERNTQMLEELRMAHDMQNAFLGRGFPVFPPSAGEKDSALRFAYLYRPSRIVGGDFFTVLPVSDTVAGILICDVMGHGVRSALVTAMIRGLVEELKASASEPAAFLHAMNVGLNGVLSDPNELLFSSAFYCTLDLASGRMHWSNAGHPPPLHIRPAENRVTELLMEGDVGPVLGIVKSATYATASTEIRSGDKLLLFTDGIYEMQCANGEDYGKDRLIRTLRHGLCLPSRALLATLLHDVETSAQNNEPDDDICLLSVDVERTGIEADPDHG